MPIGSGIFGTLSDAPNSALIFSTRKPAYLKTARQPRFTIIASTSCSFRFPLPIHNPKPQFAAAMPIIRKTYSGSPQA